jgi:RNA polymerase sigma-70 factor (ECF subfamily)
MAQEVDKVIEEVSRNYEKDLINRIKKNGDRPAFYSIVKTYNSQIFSLVFRYLGNKEDASEVTQDIFVQALRKIRQYRGEVPFIFWLRKIAVNYSLNKIRTYKRDLLKRSSNVDEIQNFSIKLQESDFFVNDLELKEKKEYINKLISKVPEPFRMAVILKDMEGLSYEEIAVTMKTNLGTVKSRLFRGREEFKKVLYRSIEEVKKYEL